MKTYNLTELSISDCPDTFIYNLTNKVAVFVYGCDLGNAVYRMVCNAF